MLKISIAVLLLALTLFSCSSGTKMIKFQKKPDDVYTNEHLKEFFKSNKSPNIVLKVPNSNDKATSNTNVGKNDNILYNGIEKELLRQGFSVRDRGLFNEILSKAGTSDYSKIQNVTNTDLILEVVNIDPAVVYSTNKIITIKKKKEEEQVGNIDYKKYGVMTEYRLIIVKNNEIAGTYKYNYTPCIEGCELNSFKITGRKNNQQVELKETVSGDPLESFIKTTTQDLVKSIRAGN